MDDTLWVTAWGFIVAVIVAIIAIIWRANRTDDWVPSDITVAQRLSMSLCVKFDPDEKDRLRDVLEPDELMTSFARNAVFAAIVHRETLAVIAQVGDDEYRTEYMAAAIHDALCFLNDYDQRWGDDCVSKSTREKYRAIADDALDAAEWSRFWMVPREDDDAV